MRITYVAFGLFAALTVAAPTQAAPAGKFLEGYTVDNISAVLRDLGASEVANVPIEGNPRLSFKLADRTYIVDFYACEDKAKGCKALQLVTAFEIDPKDTVEAVNAFNMKYLHGKAVLNKTEGLLSMRMINGLNGSFESQVASEVGLLANATDLLLAHMKEGAVAVYAPTPTTAQLAQIQPPLVRRSGFVRNKR